LPARRSRAVDGLDLIQGDSRHRRGQQAASTNTVLDIIVVVGDPLARESTVEKV
jgi:hypothetical protein